ncbi:MAG: isomerizing glutamine--fructose-6-phosphate transaminase [Actinobacteria bacterium]|nr:isomerizing glutamine--fructose-6-phosphate transaminase [Actinomycetota bacterium]
MCGIFGYIGRKNAAEMILQGLKRLEYRGYDSWGIAVSAESIKLVKKVGAIGDLKTIDLPQANIGIGHTRWATNGGVNEINAHPHFSTDKSFVLAQNGIVENFQSLKESLKKKGYKFVSETDTEVIVRLIEDKLKKEKNLLKAVRSAFLELEGRNTIILLTGKNEIIAARNGSPLVIGLNKKTNELFFSSDTLSFAPYADKIIVVDNGQLISYLNEEISLFDLKTDKKIKYKPEKIGIKSDKVDKEGYSHFMLKEINDSSYVIKQLINKELKSYSSLVREIKKAKNVYTIGSGTAGIAASQIAFYLRSIAKIKASNLIGADAQEYYNLLTNKDLIISPSQSGETADVLEVLEIAKKKKVKIASFVNMQGSTMSRISDFPFMSNAGPEICVMSTKVFVSQLPGVISWQKSPKAKKKTG